MEIDDTSVILAIVLAFATVLGILATAPTLSAGIDRLKLIFNTLGLAIASTGTLAGIVMLVWGFAAGITDLIFLSLFPFLVAGVMYNLITRRHATLWGLLGFNDGPERRRAFWNETRRLWGSAARMEAARRRIAGRSNRQGRTGKGGALALSRFRSGWEAEMPASSVRSLNSQRIA